MYYMPKFFPLEIAVVIWKKRLYSLTIVEHAGKKNLQSNLVVVFLGIIFYDSKHDI